MSGNPLVERRPQGLAHRASVPVHAVANTIEVLKTLAVRAMWINTHKLSDDERNLLRHYGEGERVVSSLQRTPARGRQPRRPTPLQRVRLWRSSCRLP